MEHTNHPRSFHRHLPNDTAINIKTTAIDTSTYLSPRHSRKRTGDSSLGNGFRTKFSFTRLPFDGRASPDGPRIDHIFHRDKAFSNDRISLLVGGDRAGSRDPRAESRRRSVTRPIYLHNLFRRG